MNTPTKLVTHISEEHDEINSTLQLGDNLALEKNDSGAVSEKSNSTVTPPISPHDKTCKIPNLDENKESNSLIADKADSVLLPVTDCLHHINVEGEEKSSM